MKSMIDSKRENLTVEEVMEELEAKRTIIVSPIHCFGFQKPLIEKGYGRLRKLKSGELTLRIYAHAVGHSLLEYQFNQFNLKGILQSSSEFELKGEIGPIKFTGRTVSFRPTQNLQTGKVRIIAKLHSAHFERVVSAKDRVVTGTVQSLPPDIYRDFSQQIDQDSMKLERNRLFLYANEFNFQLLKADNNHTFRIEVTDGVTVTNENVLSAVSFMLSFVCARRVHWQSICSVAPEKTLGVVFRALPQTKSSFYKPVELMDKSATELMEKILQFAQKSDYSFIEAFFGMLWELGSAQIRVQQLALGVAIEGITKKIVESTDEDLSFLWLKEEMKKALLQLSKREEFTQFPEPARKNSLERWNGVITGTPDMSGRKQILLAAKKVRYAITGAHLRAWSKMRNDAAHGNDPLRSISQEEVDRFFLCVNLLNQLTLCLFDYYGQAIDYTGKGWPSKKIESVALGSEQSS